MNDEPGKEATIMSVSTPHLYPVLLSDEQRLGLEEITRNGHAPAKKIRHAQVLLLSDQNRAGGKLSRTQIAQLLHMHVNTIDRVRKRFALEGEAPAINRKVRATPPTPPKLDGKGEAHLVAICCSPPPQGRVRWTLKLLADEMIKRRIVTHICAETVRKTLQKTNCSLGASSAGASPSVMRPASSRRWKMSWMSTQ
jgi:transposase